MQPNFPSAAHAREVTFGPKLVGKLCKFVNTVVVQLGILKARVQFGKYCLLIKIQTFFGKIVNR